MGVANWVLLASAAGVLYWLARRNPRLKGITWFAHGMAAAAAGVGLKVLHAVLPDWLAVLVGGGLILISLMLLRRGLAELGGRGLRLLGADVVILAGQTAGLAYFTYAHFDFGKRLVVLGVAAALECGLALAEVWAAREGSGIPRRPTLVVLGTYLVFNLGRGLAAGAQGSAAGVERMYTAAAAVQLLFTSLFGLGAVWLATAEQYEQLSEQMMQDTLTGLLNRRALRQALERAIERSRHGGEPLALLAVDLDHFKRVNDTRGHSAGDAALCAVARTLSAAVRGNDLVARLGGEEFVVLLPGLNEEGAVLGAERLRRAIVAQRFQFEGELIPLTASFGVAVFRGSDNAGESAGEVLLRQADLALYAAKRAGRNRTVAASRMSAEQAAEAGRGAAGQARLDQP